MTCEGSYAGFSLGVSLISRCVKLSGVGREGRLDRSFAQHECETGLGLSRSGRGFVKRKSESCGTPGKIAIFEALTGVGKFLSTLNGDGTPFSRGVFRSRWKRQGRLWWLPRFHGARLVPKGSAARRRSAGGTLSWALPAIRTRQTTREVLERAVTDGQVSQRDRDLRAKLRFLLRQDRTVLYPPLVRSFFISVGGRQRAVGSEGGDGSLFLLPTARCPLPSDFMQ